MAREGALRTAEFTADTVDEAVASGLRTLGVTADDVNITVVQKEQRKLGLLKSRAVVRITYDEDYCRQRRDEAEIEKYLILRYAPDGFTLRIDPVPEELHWQLLQVTTQFLIKHHVPNFKRVTRDQLVEAQSGQAYVVFEPEVIELDGVRASMYLSPTKMHAYYIQYDKGRVRRDTLNEAIAHKSIVKGLLDEALEAITGGSHPVGLPIVIALGRPPRNELASPLEYQFDQTGICISFREDASVDYRNVMRLSFIKKDGLLVRKGERTPGEKGWTVIGHEVPFKVESEKPLPKGPNTYVSQDNKELRASIDGHIEVHDGQVSVGEVFTVEGDVDYHTGNIDFDGSVVVGGDVLPGFEVKARGNVEVFGSVDDGIIEAGGDVVVQYGIFSKGRGYVTAKGDVKAWHLENVAVNARRIHVNSSAVNSRLNAEEIVEVAGNPGTLVGGVATAKDYVFANYIGSELGTRTDVVVGDTSEFDAQIAYLKRLIGRKARQRHDLIKEYERWAKTAGKALPGIAPAALDDPKEMLQEADKIDQELPEHRARLREIKTARRRLAVAKCHVFAELYDGTHVSLFTARRLFTEKVEHCTLLFDKEEVRPFPFQYFELEEESTAGSNAQPAGPADKPADGSTTAEPTPAQR